MYQILQDIFNRILRPTDSLQRLELPLNEWVTLDYAGVGFEFFQLLLQSFGLELRLRALEVSPQEKSLGKSSLILLVA